MIPGYEYEHGLLEQWGASARCEETRLGYKSPSWPGKKSGGGPPDMPDDEMLRIDGAIARLHREHRRTIKRYYLSLVDDIEEADLMAAVRNFSVSYSDSHALAG